VTTSRTRSMGADSSVTADRFSPARGQCYYPREITPPPEWRNGIRSGLKIRRPYGLTSSSLVSGTQHEKRGATRPDDDNAIMVEAFAE
jgi:hypothetical protein